MRLPGLHAAGYEARVSTGFELPGESDAEEAPPTFGSVRRGYDPEQVDTFIAQVGDRREDAPATVT